MKGPRIVSAQQQALTFTRRAFVLGGLQAGVAGMLGARMAWLSIAENERYTGLSESNRVQALVIPPRRGWIVDRFGRPIAINRTDFRVDLIPDRLRDAEGAIAALTRLLSLTPDEVERVREDLKSGAGYRPVPVKENLSWEQFAAVSVRLPELPGVAPARGFSRFYPAGAAVAHLTGYVGAASAKQYEAERDPLLITPGFKVGKEGLERTMERWLRGKPGAKRAEVTARGKLVKELTTRPEVPGHVLKLTVDAPLQAYAARRLGPNSGSAVVIDCLTGGILAMVSMPAYDPNSFSDGIGHSEWGMLSANDHLPLTNKVLQGLYPPGSTVKPMMSLALLRAGVDPHATVSCSGAYRVGGGLFHCWRRRGHGPVDMQRAVAQSCDIYFYHMGRQLGIDRIAATARDLGMGQRFDLPVASQRYGTMPDSAWKLAKYKKPWTVADTVNATIGQGYVLANPLQLAVMAARLATGKRIDPLLIHPAHDRTPAPPAATLGIPPDHLAIVRNAMAAVVNGGGTGGAARMQVPDVLLAGKTGTAQVRRITMAERRSGVLGDSALPFRMRDHSLFIGFAPFDNPRYACAVVLEHSGHIVTAAPMARDILTFLYEPERAMRTLTALEGDWGGDIRTRMAKEADAWAAAKAARTA
ncbi:penicillin-binding protein 2 [Sphingomonas sp. ID0503]|uniref:penicillin-binding protein 2 n=1 Tax=Sphingomonas sp. ID0503 TaxID=3399691 RepID=UPI003AFAC370